ncbi:MAG: hypothetical protein GY815_19175, partial [Gammaproteobacteria bacterium]|nr:hypothetical protein [Gammaproteobacteria bacterium]
ADNNAPSITSTADTAATEAALYTYTATVTDDDSLDLNDGGGSLVWSLANEPTGMAVSNVSGGASCRAGVEISAGAVSLNDTDGDGASDTEDFTIAVDVVTPAIDIISDYAEDDVNNPEPTEANYTTAGVTGVTTDNLAAVTAAIAAEEATDPDPVAQIHAIFDAINYSPSITSTAGTIATEAVEYSYTADVTDANADDVNDGNGSLAWSLANEPTGMAVSSTGVVTWTPADGILTSGTVTLTVTDDEDASDSE